MSCIKFVLPMTMLAVLAACAQRPTVPDAATAPANEDRAVAAPIGAKASPAPASAPPAAAQQEFARALAALKAGRDDEAERLLLAMTKNYPDFAGPHANLGILYARTQRAALAEAALLRATALHETAPAYNQLGILYRDAGRFDDAAQAYRRALALDDTYARAHLNLGILLDLYLDEPARALTHYERYLQLQPGADGLVNKWIVELKQRLRPAAKVAEGTQQ